MSFFCMQSPRAPCTGEARVGVVPREISDAAVPQISEPRDVGINLLPDVFNEEVPPRASLFAKLDPAVLTQDSQLLGHRRATHPVVADDRVGDVSRHVLTRREDLDNPIPKRVGQHAERIHLPVLPAIKRSLGPRHANRSRGRRGLDVEDKVGSQRQLRFPYATYTWHNEMQRPGPLGGAGVGSGNRGLQPVAR